MFGTCSRVFSLILVLLAFVPAARAEDDDPSYQGKKMTEWIALLQNGKTYTDRQKGLLALQLIGPRKSRKVTSALIAAVRENSEEKIRAGAARAIGRFAANAREDDDIALEKIRDALALALRTDKVPAVRKAAATALGEMKGRAVGAVDVLALALKDTDPGTRTEAASALRQLGKNADDALPDQQAALKNPKLERLTRIHCARALGLIKVLSAVPSLKEVLADTKNDSELRRACAAALGDMGNQAAEAVPVLATVLTAKDSDVLLRRAAAEALDQMGVESRPALEALRTVLKDNDQFVRSLSLHAISHMGKELGDEREKTVRAIFVAMDDNALEVRVAAIEALGNLGADVLGEQTKDAVNRLTDAARDPQKAVSEAAKVALKKLQGMP
jgi:HEAT repeat protein